MRIVGGALSGRKLAHVGAGAPAAQLRPTSDRVRQALFNILEHGDYPPFEGARALGLFAGTGALGFEALSRGAERALFVEEHSTGRGLIRENIEALDLIGRTRLFRRDATRLGPNRDAAYTHIFLDPPYGKGLAPRALASARDGGWIAESAVIVVETGVDEEFEPPEGFEKVDERHYGAAALTILRPVFAAT